MNRWRRVLCYPLSRIAVGAIVLAGPLVVVSAIASSRDLEPLPVVAAALSASCAIAALYVVGVIIERRGADELVLPAGRSLVIDGARGFALGAALFAAVILCLALAGFAHITAPPSPPLAAVALGFVMFLFVGIAEEIALRALLFRILEEWLGSWAALVLSALLFGALHLGNPHATLVAGLAIALEAGLLLAALYALTRSLVFVVSVHWAWNFFEGPIFGTAVSGHGEPSVLTTVTSGSATFTGGEFGPEASVVAVLVCGAVTVAALVLAARHGKLRRRGFANGS
ncbi:MAG TPA: CPBP family intramembrane glutamic endopeptidase [Kofleriaceae bacterium]|nr:CPBP family intramembrane glutamic endopeptidase [Kofleriaceae bacterium]